jgi:hypothetical protein
MRPPLVVARHGQQEDHRGGGCDRCAGRRAGARHPERQDGGFAARAITRDVNSEGKELARLGAEVVAATSTTKRASERGVRRRARRLLRDVLLGALLAREGDRGEEPWRPPRRRPGVRHVIWSTLEDTRRWVPLDDDRMPTLMGKYKVPHFDGKGEANRSSGPRRADDAAAHLVLLGQLHLLRRRTEARVPTACSPSRCRWATAQAARDRRRGHRQVRLRHLQGGKSSSARRWALPAST